MKLTPLYLTHNYRSNKKIIEWNNELFSKLSTNTSNYFLPATALKSDTSGIIESHSSVNANEEAEYLTNHIAATQRNHPHANIAILVRSRNQLQNVIPLLIQKSIDFEAVGIDSLAKEQAIYDALTLYMLAQDLYDRQHWIALLRSPMAGLSMQDIYILSQSDEHTIWQNMQSNNKVSIEAASILKRIVPVISQHLIEYQRFDHAMHSMKLWHKLGGPWTLKSTYIFEHIEKFYQTISNMHKHYGLLNYKQAQQIIKQTTITRPAEKSHPIVLMTVHKSKGLEFDIVYCIGLEKASPIEQKPIISCYDVYLAGEKRTLIHTQPKHTTYASSLQKFIRTHIQKNIDQEQIRLCYVACTRAKAQLHLSYATNKGQASSRTWLNLMKPQLEKTQCIDNTFINNDKPDKKIKNIIRRLPTNWQHPYVGAIQTFHTPLNNESTISLRWGEVVHTYLQWYAKNTNQHITQETIKTRVQYYARYHHVNDENTLTWVTKKLHQAHKDEIFSWIFAKHPLQLHEQPISYQNKPYRVDRCFLTKEKTLWIIDFKTYGIENLADAAPKSLVIRDSYKTQLSLYKKAMEKQYPSYHVQTGLYFPLQQTWHEIITQPETIEQL